MDQLRQSIAVVSCADLAAQKFWRAVARALNDAMQFESTPLVGVFTRWPPSIYAKASSSDGITILDTVMGPFPAPDIEPSIWSMSRSFGLSFPEGLGLADDLAAALCLRMRHSGETPETLSYIDMFFDRFDPGDVVFALCRWTWDYRRKAFDSTLEIGETVAVHLIQHCSELRPEWWLDVLAYSQTTASEDERLMMLALQAELERRGPCTACPKEQGYSVDVQS
ncbi:hypothetical protein EXIGLDRAFT_775183 [Exidia glandulosa HHB12029]|uniref:Uncharacterized protein n=1 Tax=Exidia glandulosa HHB12029 TaxID=1314781 RepID=A0A165E0N6_EXIGL|nr:hypothetical protein EXIGLDRAFT_775183 [Exidia glandulosa HHB12029]